MIGLFVTAKLKGQDDCRQGAILSTDPLRIRTQSGEEYDCEGSVSIVVDKPKTCIGCGLPLGSLCGRCETNIRALVDALSEAGLRLELSTESTKDHGLDSDYPETKPLHESEGG